MSLVIECQCFPCVGYIEKLIRHKYIKIEQCESFQKMSFRNRYIILGANGIQNLTVPVVGGREQKTLIKEVRIDNSTDWQTKHWRSLLSAYSKAPFFNYYYQGIKDLIYSKEENLFSFNINILNWVCNALRIKPVIAFTEEFNLVYSVEEDGRNYFLPKSFQKVEETFPYYSQVFEDRTGFQPNLSIIDLILCEGPNSLNLIRQFSK